ncbi:CapA family protein, partial [Nocardioides sp. P5_C9_2]
MGRPGGGIALVAALVLVLAGCSSTAPEPPDDPGAGDPSPRGTSIADEPSRQVTLAFAGDVHFEAHLRRLLRRPGGGLGPIAATLREADVAMLNLETAVTDRRRRDPKELEDAEDRYHFRAPAGAFDVLAAAGVDVVSVANNHAGDYGQAGLADTLRAARGTVEVVGAGRDQVAAFTPYRVTRRGIDLAFLAADSVFREGSSDVWAAGPDNAGVAAARESRPDALLRAVSSAAEVDDVVVVYLHWGREYQSCPSQRQRLLARRLADAGADVVVGSHAHVLGGAGWSGDTYVGYG